MIEKTHWVIKEKISRFLKKIVFCLVLIGSILFPIWISIHPNSPLEMNIVNPIKLESKDIMTEPSEINEKVTQGNFTIQTLVIKNRFGTDLYNVTLAGKWFWPINFSYNNFSNNISFNLEDDTNEYVIVNISIPRNESPGEYKGEIQIIGYYTTLYDKVKIHREVPISITVPDLRASNKTLRSENKTVVIINT